MDGSTHYNVDMILYKLYYMNRSMKTKKKSDRWIFIYTDVRVKKY